MNKRTPEEESEEKLPFSFQKKKVSEDKIAAHWQKIAARLAEKSAVNETEPDGTDVK